MKIYPFQAIYPELEIITSVDSFFGSVKHQFEKYRKTGFFKRASQEAFYIHEIIKFGRVYRGLIATTDISDFLDNKILVHENTLAAKQQTMMELLLDRKAMIKPILLGYDNNSKIDAYLEKFVKNNKPVVKGDFEETEESHRFYEIADGNEILKLSKLFNGIKKSYIADGHHRRATILHLYKKKKFRAEKGVRQTFLTAMFPFTDLEIYDFNRVATVFDIISRNAFIVALSKYCKIKLLNKPRKPKSKFEITMYFDGEWFSLKWKKKMLDNTKKSKVVLDADLLNEYVFNQILSIEDVKVTSRVKYYEGVNGLDNVIYTVNSDSKKVGFCIYPVTIDELKLVADNKLDLPPKSTWFEPRMKNGMISEDF